MASSDERGPGAAPDTPYHPGEREVQRRAGVAEAALRAGRAVHRTLPPAAAAFLAERELVVLAAADSAGRPWATVLGGPAGFVRAVSESRVELGAVPGPGDPLAGALAPGAWIGILAIDLETRRRARLNGRVTAVDGGALRVDLDQVYANCPQHIRSRVLGLLPGRRPSPDARRLAGLSDTDRSWIRSADTFFIASLHPEHGADASHRGGPPGFVEVDGDRLRWPDYPGNTMFNTLGNLAANPRAGVVFVDFAGSATLQLSGTTRVAWPWDERAARAGHEPARWVELTVEQAVATAHALPWRVIA